MSFQTLTFEVSAYAVSPVKLCGPWGIRNPPPSLQVKSATTITKGPIVTLRIEELYYRVSRPYLGFRYL